METAFLVPFFVVLAIPFIFKLYLRYLANRRIKSIDFEVGYNEKYKAERWKLHALGLGYIVFSLVLALVLTLAAKEVRLLLLPLNTVFTYTSMVFGVAAPFIILSLVVMALPLEILMFALFPKVIPERDKRIHLGDTMLVVGAAFCLLVPLAFIPFDTYLVVTQEEIVKNPLFSFQEQRYALSEVALLELNGTVGSELISFKVFAILQSGERVELWSEWGHDPYLSQEEIDLVRFFHERGIEIKVNEPSEQEYAQIYRVTESNREKLGRTVVAEVKAIFTELKTIAAS